MRWHLGAGKAKNRLGGREGGGGGSTASYLATDRHSKARDKTTAPKRQARGQGLGWPRRKWESHDGGAVGEKRLAGCCSCLFASLVLRAHVASDAGATAASHAACRLLAVSVDEQEDCERRDENAHVVRGFTEHRVEGGTKPHSLAHGMQTETQSNPDSKWNLSTVDNSKALVQPSLPCQTRR